MSSGNKIDQKLIKVNLILTGTTFAGGQNTKLVEGLATDVRVEKCGLPGKNKCSVDINNMKQDDIDRISTLTPINLDVKRNRIIVEAGDETSGMGQVFVGEIFFAVGTYDSPDLGVHIEAYTGLFPSLMKSPPFSQPGPMSGLQMIQQFAGEAGYKFENNKTPDKKLRDPVIDGSPMQKMMTVAKQCKWQLICDDERIIVSQETQPLGDTIQVSKDTGMIGYPSLSQNGIQVRHKFSQNFRQGGKINVKSIVPKASGEWKILRLQHMLQAFGAGPAWDTIIDGVYIR